jgi:hypothetical protein
LKKYSFWLFIFLICFLFIQDAYQSIAVSISIIIFFEILLNSNNRFVFREWALLLYAINYLIAPAITYNLPPAEIKYGMKITSDQYFELAIPGFILLAFGMSVIKTTVFNVDFYKVNASSLVNQRLLKNVTFFGLLLNLLSVLIEGELSFFIYLLSLVRFVGAFALFSMNIRHWYWVFIVLVIELIKALIIGMYHDAIMWIVFFALFYVYTSKPRLQIKLTGALIIIIIVLFVQAIKVSYRDEVWTGDKEATLETVYDVGSTKTGSDQLIGSENLLSTLNRGNQAWIFASTVDNMDRAKNFQGLTNVNKYMEAALLPRFLAPNKIKSGDKEIFNEFSGHTINEGTSMGLGIFADGYVAYGATGVYIFAFVLGLIFALTFKLVERWTKVSPFYVLLLLPLLNYAVRPDCELQTTINHLFKGIMLFGFLVYLTRKRFSMDSAENQRKLSHLNLIK